MTSGSGEVYLASYSRPQGQDVLRHKINHSAWVLCWWRGVWSTLIYRVFWMLAVLPGCARQLHVDARCPRQLPLRFEMHLLWLAHRCLQAKLTFSQIEVWLAHRCLQAKLTSPQIEVWLAHRCLQVKLTSSHVEVPFCVALSLASYPGSFEKFRDVDNF